MSIEPSGRETILLVDDEHAVRTVVGVMLRRAGYEVIQAASGEEALRLFNDHAAEVRILVSDVKMPGMHGPTLAQRLIDVQPGLYVLFMSGYIKFEPSALRLGHRRVEFLAKPFESARLVAKLRELTTSPSGSSGPHLAESAAGRLPGASGQFQGLGGHSGEHVSENAKTPVFDNGPAASPTVLIIDGDVTTVDTYARTLRDERLEVVTATTGETGLREIATRRPDVILLDVRLPGVDGLEVLRQLRRTRGRRAAVAIVTGDYFVDDQTAAEFTALGAELWFKPLWAGDVVAIVRGLLSASTLRATSLNRGDASMPRSAAVDP